MSSELSEPPKLSLVAEFDDMCRFSNSLISVDENELVQLIQNCEQNRLQWHSLKRELDLKNDSNEKLENENKILKTQLMSARFAFAKEVQNREALVKQRNAFKEHLKTIKEFVLEDPINCQTQDTKEKVLSYLNLNHNHLETVNERQSEESFSGLEYDVTEEDILNESMKSNKRKSASKRISLNRKSTECQPINEVFNKSVSMSGIQTTPNHFANQFTPQLSPFVSSSPYLKQTKSLTISRSGQNRAELRTIDLDKHSHTFQKKKAFKPSQCGPCGKSIGFCGDFLLCRECRGICHIRCQNLLALPCIPYQKPNGKSSRMLLIADYAPQNTRPMIPSLIIHCCNEIEKRGLQEDGLYRKCGSDKEVQELKHKILNSKTGIPVMSSVDVHVVCGVVKQFLRDLDEPIVTRILWRDFVRAADQENPDEESALIMQTVSELPTANRDTLAFLMLHLQRIAGSADTLMSRSSLARVFGPTIVGYSTIDLPTNQLLAENPKQIKVMEALLRIDDNFWNSIISTTDMCEQNENNSEYGDSPDRRRSIGTRLFGGVVQRGSLTPLRSTPYSRRDGVLSLKPLF